MSSELRRTAAAAATVSCADAPPVIEVRHLVKEYRLGALEGLRTLGRRLLGHTVPPRQQFRALDDVSFSIRRGEVVGIIGHNGAGKSTLLKMLCNITTPTSGSVAVRGRVAPLIEVGAGLVGDMTGRENIYLNASILGLTRAQIDAKVDEIIAFAELEQFIDTPVKRYSSGMHIRLAFSIAIAVDAPILIIDEVLAVGDVAFQRRCFDRITSLLADQQKVILLVSHNIRLIERLCTRVLFLDHGRLVDDGKPLAVCAQFHARMDRSITAARTISAYSGIVSTGEIEVTALGLVDVEGRPTDHARLHAPARVRVGFRVMTEIKSIDVAIGIHTVDLINIATQSIRSGGLLSLVPGEYTLDFCFQDLPILPGHYALRLFFQDSLGTNLVDGQGLSPFFVEPGDIIRSDLSVASLIHLPMTWRLNE